MHLGMGLRVRNAQASSLFDPLSLSPRTFLPASALGTQFRDTAATQSVSADGDAVALIRNSASTTIDFTQASLASRPVWRANSGLPYWEADGFDDRLVGPAISTLIGTGQYEVIIAARITAKPASLASSWAYPSLLSDAGSGYFNIHITHHATAQIGHFAFGSPAADTFARLNYTLGVDVVIAAWCDGTNIFLSMDGGSPVSATQTGPSIRTGLAQLFGSVASQGRIYAMLTFTRVLAAGERASAVTWAAATQGRAL